MWQKIVHKITNVGHSTSKLHQIVNLILLQTPQKEAPHYKTHEVEPVR